MKFIPRLLALILIPALGAQPPPPAVAPEARQFDFWVGEWEVFGPDGKKAGENRIEKMADGWGLLESWTGAGGYTGKSLNAWVPSKKHWQQFWIGVGGVLELSGGLNPRGEMVLSGRSRDGEGRETINRITWTPLPDGTVRQHWQISTDGGGFWSTAFDGRYRKKAK